MNKKFIILGLAGIILCGSALVSGRVLAYWGDSTVKGPYYTEERHEAITKTFEINDYNAWKALMQGRGRATQVVNEHNFARFSEAHKLALEGKNEEARKICEELGLGLNNGSGKVYGQRVGGCRGLDNNL